MTLDLYTWNEEGTVLKLTKAESVLTPFGFKIRLLDQQGRWHGHTVEPKEDGYLGLWQSEIRTVRVIRAYEKDGPAGVWDAGGMIVGPDTKPV